MDIKYNRAEVYLSMPNEIFVSFKNGVRIVLFTVGLGLSTLSYGHSGIIPPKLNDVQLEASNVEISLATVCDNRFEHNTYQTEQDLFTSLQMHRADQLLPVEMDGFRSVSKEITMLDFTDSMVCYEPEDSQITYDILDKSGLTLHITQYLDYPKDQVVYSIEKDSHFFLAGHAPIKDLGIRLQRIIDDLLRKKG